MRIKITKISAARNQLEEAIRLFFEERDYISIHTLVGAALQILNDHIGDDEACKSNLLFHYNTLYIKKDCRKFWQNKLWEARNFFKHADKDLKNGKISIEFETDLNELNIFECIRCLIIVEKDQYIASPEIEVFKYWFICNKPEAFSEDYILELKKNNAFPIMAVSRKECKNLLHELKTTNHIFPF